MALRLIGTLLGDPETQRGRVVRIYRDNVWEELRARLFIDGVVYEPGDYHTSDKEDVWSTGADMLIDPLRK